MAASAPYLARLSDLAGKVGLSLAVVQFASDIYMGDPKEITVNTFRNIITNSMGLYATSAVQFSMLDIYAIDLAMTSFSNAA